MSPAYLVTIVRQKCAAVTCTRDAEVSLFNGMNAPIADYCRRCGEKVLKRVNGEVE